MIVTSIKRVSTDFSNGQGNAESFMPSFFPNTRHILFLSRANNLISGDTSGGVDAFIKNLVTGAVTRVNVNDQGAQVLGETDWAVLSPDGNKVLLSTYARLNEHDTNAFSDLYLKDLNTGAVERLTLLPGGFQPNGDSTYANFSPDGTKIVFLSASTGLTQEGVPDPDHFGIFTKDLITGEFRRVDIDNLGGTMGVDSLGRGAPVFSPDGTKIMFLSNDADSGGGAIHRLYLKDINTGVLTTLSHLDTFFPSFSRDGTKVVFATPGDLVEGDTNGQIDIYVRDLVANTITRITPNGMGVETDGASIEPVFSPDGTKVAFISHATNLVAGDTNNQADIFIKDLVSGELLRFSTDILEGFTGGTPLTPVFSENGMKLMFVSTADNIVPNDTNSRSDVFMISLANEIYGTPRHDQMDGTNVDDFIKGYRGADVIFAHEGDDFVYGGLDDDLIYGGAGNDKLRGDTGHDDLYGGEGDDHLDGGAGDDILVGGAGRDRLIGGADADEFWFSIDSLAPTYDIVKDFNVLDGDTLVLDNLLTGYDPLTDLIADFIRLTENVAGHTTISVDANGTLDGSHWIRMVRLDNVTGLNVQDMLDDGQLIVQETIVV